MSSRLEDFVVYQLCLLPVGFAMNMYIRALSYAILFAETFSVHLHIPDGPMDGFDTWVWLEVGAFFSEIVS